MCSLVNLQGKRICVAYSGGVDSTALLHYLLSKREQFHFTVSAVHCEHGLRGDASVADMQFVQAQCKAWGVQLWVYREDCKARAKMEKCSEETAGRNFRRAVFEEMIQSGLADVIATAHHENDEAETVLFRLARGSALGGASGMQQQDGWLVRPFLRWSRAEIERYATENSLQFCVDETNFDSCYTRNQIRLSVLPKLEEAVPGAVKSLSRFARLAKEDDDLLNRLSESLIMQCEDGVCVAFSKEAPLFRRACLKVLKSLGVEKDYTFAHLNALMDLQSAERGALTHLPQSVVAQKQINGIVFSWRKHEEDVALPAPCPFTENGFDGGRYEVKIFDTPTMYEENTWKVLKVDADKLPKNAVFRFRMEGDEIVKFGGGRKTLKKLFNEKKCKVSERAYLPLIACEKEVLVVCGVEIADTLKVDENTKRVLYIVLQRKEGENL